MLNLVFGRNASGKSEYVRNLVAKAVKSGGSGYIIIVPEQFSYETEKAMLELVGAAGMLNVEVLSLSRLADIILAESGKKSDKPSVDDGVRLLTMSLALESLGDEINIYKKYVSRPALAANLVSFATELKQCSVSTEALKLCADKMKPSSLKSKLTQLVMIVSLYNSMLERSFFDDTDSLTQLSYVLEDFRFFENKTVVFDAFTRFTSQELAVVSKIIAQCDNTYITFCYDKKEAQNDFSIFSNISAQISIVKQLAAKNNVALAKPVELEVKPSFRSPALEANEKSFFRAEKIIYNNPTDGEIEVCCAANPAQECEYVAREIKKLLRLGKARCRDILVLERSKDSYDNELTAALKKYGVPFFEDKRRPLDAQPLIVFIRTLLETACNGITSETLMRHLKTGLTSLDDDEISELENYAFVWKIKASQWSEDFTQNPRGYGQEINDFDKTFLEELNSYRRKAVAPVLAFRRDFLAAQAEERTAVLYNYIASYSVRDKLKKLAADFAREGKTALCDEQDDVWSFVMELLDKMYLAAASKSISAKRYYELFDILLSQSTLGTLPRGLDDVMLGVADRTRTENKKYVFIVGANDGVFPLCPSTMGLLNDNDRIELRTQGIELAQTAEYKQIEERYIAYSALTSAHEKLFVSFSSADYSGENLMPSSIVNELEAIFPNLCRVSPEQADALELIESPTSAFETLCADFRNKTVMTSTLKKYFSTMPEYAGRVVSLENAVDRSEKHIKSTEIATELFGREMYASASKTEVFYKCPFQFFCRYGINAEPRREAVIDAALSGSVIHYVFENMMSNFSKPELEKMADEELLKNISTILKKYLNDNMGGEDNKSRRFMTHYKDVSRQTFTILKRMIEEFKTSEFTPVDFELQITPSGEIKPYELRLDDGGMLKITGSVDRVDMMEKDGKSFLRVVDYKSGGKVFRLSDVLGGLSTQMLIYLFAIDENGKKKYGDIVPCGVLYMSAKPEPSTLGRNATQSEIDKKRLLSNKMSGIVLNDEEVVRGMEEEAQGIFIPASIDAEGKLKGSLITGEQLDGLKKKVDSVLKNMLTSLHNGYIPVLPSGSEACKWCDYKSVCGFEDGDETRTIDKLSDEQALEILDGGEEENNAE